MLLLVKVVENSVELLLQTTKRKESAKNFAAYAIADFERFLAAEKEQLALEDSLFIELTPDDLIKKIRPQGIGN